MKLLGPHINDHFWAIVALGIAMAGIGLALVVYIYAPRTPTEKGRWESIDLTRADKGWIFGDQVYRVVIPVERKMIAGHPDDTETFNQASAIAFEFSHQVIMGRGRINALMTGYELHRFHACSDWKRVTELFAWIGDDPKNNEHLSF